jgi:hypothetical protein
MQGAAGRACTVSSHAAFCILHTTLCTLCRDESMCLQHAGNAAVVQLWLVMQPWTDGVLCSRVTAVAMGVHLLYITLQSSIVDDVAAAVCSPHLSQKALARSCIVHMTCIPHTLLLQLEGCISQPPCQHSQNLLPVLNLKHTVQHAAWYASTRCCQ